MPRDKKKMSVIELEDHIIKWTMDQIDKLRGVVDEVEDSAEIKEKDRLLVFAGIADQLEELLELINKIHHDERHIIEWVRNFICSYKPIDDEN